MYSYTCAYAYFVLDILSPSIWIGPSLGTDAREEGTW